MIDRPTIDHLARLARLTVPEEEKDQLAQDIASMVGFIDTLQKTSLGVKKEQVFVQKNITRDDLVAPLGSVYDLVEAAPLHKDGFVQVPKVIGE